MYSFQKPRSRESPRRELPVLRWIIELLKETFLLFLGGDVQKKLSNDDAVAREVALEVPDVMVALLPDVLCYELLRDLLFCQQLGMDTDDERLFVIATIENADPPAFWQTLARARTIDKSIAALNEFSASALHPD